MSTWCEVELFIKRRYVVLLIKTSRRYISRLERKLYHTVCKCKGKQTKNMNVAFVSKQ